ncbi:MAG: substrate-binding domain-containing protein [Peptococcaceae bacterium]|nr:substrate-binding domain-containing protein [Peptococcaceae bacterium]
MKKIFSTILVSSLMLAGLTGCGGNSTTEIKEPITVVSREDGSGTRGAFVELFGIEQKNEQGEKVDYTTVEASITNSTSVMLTTIAGNKNAIGYISLGSLNDTVKAIAINGAYASVENIKNGSYQAARPFNIATLAEVSAVAEDFIDYIMSAEGQAIVEEAGYISIAEQAEHYQGGSVSGKVVVAGSSSVTPVMEKLAEAYEQANTGVTVEIQQSDSTTGMNFTIDGVCDIGMASRALKESEIAKGLIGLPIATDGIAVIVNNDNAVEGLTDEQVKQIFMGEVTDWSQLQ